MNTGYEIIKFEDALARLHVNYNNERYDSYITTKTWLGFLNCVITLSPSTGMLGVFSVNNINTNIDYSHNYHIGINDMNEDWYYFPSKEALMEFCKSEELKKMMD